MYHGALGAYGQPAADGADTREELDAERPQVEHVTHDGAIEEAHHFRYAGATCRQAQELKQQQEHVQVHVYIVAACMVAAGKTPSKSQLYEQLLLIIV